MNSDFYKKKAYCLLFLVMSVFALEARRNKYQLDISRNDFGLDKRKVICTYDDIAKQVTCESVDQNDPDASNRRYFANVYVRKLTSDPTGLGYIGKYRNPDINPGFPTEYTSTRENFTIYTSKY